MKSFVEFIAEQKTDHKKAEKAFVAAIKTVVTKGKVSVMYDASKDEIHMMAPTFLVAKVVYEISRAAKPKVLPFGYIPVYTTKNGVPTVILQKP